MRAIEMLDGISIVGRNINNLRYAYYTVLVADLVEKLQALVDEVNTASEEKGLKINRETTECRVSR